MDSAVNSTVGASLVMQQAQTAQQVQMQVFKDALDIQKNQVSELMASASANSQPNSGGLSGSLINTFA